MWCYNHHRLIFGIVWFYHRLIFGVVWCISLSSVIVIIIGNHFFRCCCWWWCVFVVLFLWTAWCRNLKVHFADLTQLFKVPSFLEHNYKLCPRYMQPGILLFEFLPSHAVQLLMFWPLRSLQSQIVSCFVNSVHWIRLTLPWNDRGIWLGVGIPSNKY